MRAHERQPTAVEVEVEEEEDGRSGREGEGGEADWGPVRAKWERARAAGCSFERQLMVVDE
jgi:hypothetical protein